MRNFGLTNLEVSSLGYGAGHIGSNDLNEDFVGSLLNEIVNLGVNLIDTARGYGLSEERIGRHLSYRRNDFILSTKVGYGIDGYDDWTYDCIAKGVDTALQNLQTDYIDIVHLHSCNKNILEKGDVIKALEEAKKEGKIKAIAYSGENEDLLYAIECNRFDSIQCSVNLFDQNSLYNHLQIAKSKNMGIIAKRPLANVPWRFDSQPFGEYCEEYWLRMKKMNLNIPKEELADIALRFAAYNNAVTSCIVGSLNLDNIKKNISSIQKGALDDNLFKKIKEEFISNSDNWIGQV